ncbi:unnamed protein product [Calypogeia fissa]
MRWKKHRNWRRGGSPLWMKEKDRNARRIFLNEVKGKTLEEPEQIDMSAGQKEKDHFPSMVNHMNKVSCGTEERRRRIPQHWGPDLPRKTQSAGGPLC